MESAPETPIYVNIANVFAGIPVAKHLSQSAGQRATAMVLLWLCGMCLRLTVLAIPPVVPLLHADLNLSETGIGWLSSLPPMLFASLCESFCRARSSSRPSCLA